jgi:hypothetical protein
MLDNTAFTIKGPSPYRASLAGMTKLLVVCSFAKLSQPLKYKLRLFPDYAQ